MCILFLHVAGKKYNTSLLLTIKKIHEKKYKLEMRPVPKAPAYMHMVKQPGRVIPKATPYRNYEL